MNTRSLRYPSGWRSWTRSFAAAIIATATLGLFAAGSEAQQPTAAVQENLSRVLGSLNQPKVRAAGLAQSNEPPRLRLAPEGFVRHLAAPPGQAFQPDQIVPGQPAETAQAFVRGNKTLLGITSPNVDVTPFQTRPGRQRTNVRLQQTYGGIPVFAGHVAVQLDENSAVEFVASDIAPEVNQLDADPAWTAATVSAAEATGLVNQNVAPAAGGAAFSTTEPKLQVFVPSVLGEPGPVQLVWEIKVDCEDLPELNHRWLLDAKTGAVVRRYALTHSALNRQISDSANTTAYPGALVRVEGGPASGIANADSAYAFLGHTYNFYLSNHGRDSYDNAGATIRATTRYCPNTTNCPWGNAQWTGTRIRFGNNFTTDDVTGHEFTHAVTENTSGLIYANASGAINESLSDVFGEFVDLGNGSGDDSAGVRWDMGEDLPNGRIRSMSNPPARSDPDRLGSPLYVPATNDPNNDNDNGGVHSNSGVNNKLCYLLVDGDSFNGWTVNGLGVSRIADLYYEVNANLLNAGSDWSDLYDALRQAAVNLSWSVDDRNNLYRACRAVEIASGDARYVDWSLNCVIKNGYWSVCNGLLGGPYQTVNQGNSGLYPGDALYIRGGSYNEDVFFQKIATIRSYSGSAVIGN